jgi:hypothetical protein
MFFEDIIQKKEQHKKNVKDQKEIDMMKLVISNLSDPIDPDDALRNAKQSFFDQNKYYSQLSHDIIYNSKNAQELKKNILTCMDTEKEDLEYTDSCSSFGPKLHARGSLG